MACRCTLTTSLSSSSWLSEALPIALCSRHAANAARMSCPCGTHVDPCEPNCSSLQGAPQAGQVRIWKKYMLWNFQSRKQPYFGTGSPLSEIPCLESAMWPEIQEPQWTRFRPWTPEHAIPVSNPPTKKHQGAKQKATEYTISRQTKLCPGTACTRSQEENHTVLGHHQVRAH
jgi:hypothetical protein